MDRREILKMIALATGGTFIGGEIFLTGCASDKTSTIGFSKDEIAYMDEIAETILPRTKTPGAKDAAVGNFMAVMVNDCYTPDDQKIFHQGLTTLNNLSQNKYKENFMSITPAQRHDLLVIIDAEAKEAQKKKSEFDKVQTEKQRSADFNRNMTFKKEEMPAHYFTMIKQLTMLGFFTSKVGANEALRFVAVPGRFDACIPYKKGDKAWAT
ncbi:MAG TPA: Twin-arginine translocation pathway signal [Sphingobacteriaceae bacterium]|nr:Twin-arginine translocation pathway signal [Sphingobacteriaceae bacterium]